MVLIKKIKSFLSSKTLLVALALIFVPALEYMQTLDLAGFAAIPLLGKVMMIMGILLVVLRSMQTNAAELPWVQPIFGILTVAITVGETILSNVSSGMTAAQVIIGLLLVLFKANGKLALTSVEPVAESNTQKTQAIEIAVSDGFWTDVKRNWMVIGLALFILLILIVEI